MKVKKHTTTRPDPRRDDILPHEAAAHLFALIRRNLLARREPKAPAPEIQQLSFTF